MWRAGSSSAPMSTDMGRRQLVFPIVNLRSVPSFYAGRRQLICADID